MKRVYEICRVCEGRKKRRFYYLGDLEIGYPPISVPWEHYDKLRSEERDCESCEGKGYIHWGYIED